MISRKLVVVLALVLVALGVVSYTTSQSRYGTTKGGGFVEVVDSSLDPGSVERIEAWLGSAPDSVVALARTGSGWEVASRWGWQAKEDLVTRLLDDLGGLKGEKRATGKGEILSEFQIDEEDGLHVVGKASGGSELFHLVVGKSASRGGTFVRRHGSNDVYLTPASLRTSFGVWGDDPKAPDAKRWIELRIHKVERNDVDRIVLRDGDRTIVLAKEFAKLAAAESGDGGEESAASAEEAAGAAVDRTNWTWKPDESGEFDKPKADGVLSTLSSLYAADVADPDSLEAYGLAGDVARTAELSFPDGRTVTVYFGNVKESDENRVYVKVGADGKPAEIYKSTVDRLFPERSELAPKAKEG